MSTVLLLVDLAEDVIYSIFGCCDIASVLSVGQTCRHLHGLAFNKSVWLVLLDDLRRRLILNHTFISNLEALSMAEMIRVIRRLITGPYTWSPKQYDSVVEISEQITLHPAITAGNKDQNVVKLLPSGRYVLFANAGRLECWSVANDGLVWGHTSTIQPFYVYDFAIEETDNSATIVVCIRSRAGQNYVEMVRLNLQTGIHTSLLIARAPGTRHPHALRDPAVCEALAAVRLTEAEPLYMIINWKENLYFIVRSGHPDIKLHGALIPGHILLSDPQQSRLHLISSDVVGSHGTPTLGMNDLAEFSYISVGDVPKLSTFVDSDTEQLEFGPMYVHDSPIRDGEYSIWRYGKRSVADSGVFLSHRLSIQTNGESQWCRRTRSALQPGSAYYSDHPITYHGHFFGVGTFQEHGVLAICSAAAASPGTVQAIDVPDGAASHIDIAPYAGALTYSTDSSIVIQYYE
ncbi:hypothetical protein MSAN_01739900 [Mycena sanguinolenta]|uniref:F-box domain-containing protein n=1 Tax=Mycena sanguinolenta TaxID=230812 RepID=A0A8H7CVG7_9AGAR|nr:hypothetical protein MSAN_01739900 [Mycena sanguinolenta]